MKIGIHVLGSDFAPETNLKRVALTTNYLPSETTITILGDQE